MDALRRLVPGSFSAVLTPQACVLAARAAVLLCGTRRLITPLQAGRSQRQQRCGCKGQSKGPHLRRAVADDAARGAHCLAQLLINHLV